MWYYRNNWPIYKCPMMTENNHNLLLVGFIALAAGTTFKDM